MHDQRQQFARRVDKLAKRHRAMASGYSASIEDDGLIVVKPRRVQFRFPLRGFVLLMAIFMGFKGFMYASLGEVEYRDRLAVLQNGTSLEKAGAFVMGIDPVSDVVAQILISLQSSDST